MVRGTTAQFKFNLPYTYDELKIVKITFWQPGNNKLPLELDLNRCLGDGDKKELSVTLLQKETLRFSDKTKAYVQLRAISKDGHSFASKQETLTVYPVYNEDVLDDGAITPPPSDDGWSYLDGGIV